MLTSAGLPNSPVITVPATDNAKENNVTAYGSHPIAVRKNASLGRRFANFANSPSFFVQTSLTSAAAHTASQRRPAASVIKEEK